MPDKTPRILCIDDDADILDVARMCLETVGGFEVLTCDNGPEALAKVAGIMPDLIMLDVMLPGMDGPTILQELQQIAAISRIPVIFMTARVQPREIETYLALGAVAVISKPFDPMTLSAEVAAILVKAQARI